MTQRVPYAPPPSAVPGTREWEQQLQKWEAYQDYLRTLDPAVADAVYEQDATAGVTDYIGGSADTTGSSHQSEKEADVANGYTYTARVELHDGSETTVRIQDVPAADKEAAVLQGRRMLRESGGDTRKRHVEPEEIEGILEDKANKPRGKPLKSNDPRRAGQSSSSGPQSQSQGQQGQSQQGQGQQQGQQQGQGQQGTAQSLQESLEQLKEALEGQQGGSGGQGNSDIVLLRKTAAPMEGAEAVEAIAGIAQSAMKGDMDAVKECLLSMPQMVQDMVAEIVQSAAVSADTPTADGKTLRELVEEVAREKAEEVTPKEEHLTVTVQSSDDDDAPVINTVNDPHPAMEQVLQLVEANKPVTLVGPTGCGKSHLFYQVATALGAKAESLSVTAGVQEWHLTGRKTLAQGGGMAYEPVTFVEAFESDDLYLWLADEYDGADPNTVLILNQALSNQRLPLPNRGDTAHRGKGFRFFAAMNTWGRGADRQFVGRNKQDEAAMDRLRIGMIYMDYDRGLEQRLVTGTGKSGDSCSSFLRAMWETRDKCAEHKMQVNVSTRFIIESWDMVLRYADWDTGRALRQLAVTWTDGERRKAGIPC